MANNREVKRSLLKETASKLAEAGLLMLVGIHLVGMSKLIFKGLGVVSFFAGINRLNQPTQA